MRECPDGDLRDLLPDLVHDRLPPADADRLRAHVATCAACAEEMEFLLGLRRSFTAPVEVDVEAIAREVVRRTTGTAARRPGRGAIRAGGWLKAAALVLAVGGASWVVARPGGTPLAPAAAVDLAFAGGVADLADEDLRQLEGAIAELERQPLADAEPIGETPQADDIDQRGT